MYDVRVRFNHLLIACADAAAASAVVTATIRTLNIAFRQFPRFVSDLNETRTHAHDVCGAQHVFTLLNTHYTRVNAHRCHGMSRVVDAMHILDGARVCSCVHVARAWSANAFRTENTRQLRRRLMTMGKLVSKRVAERLGTYSRTCQRPECGLRMVPRIDYNPAACCLDDRERGVAPRTARIVPPLPPIGLVPQKHSTAGSKIQTIVIPRDRT